MTSLLKVDWLLSLAAAARPKEKISVQKMIPAEAMRAWRCA
jgi:hypothetical protein